MIKLTLTSDTHRCHKSIQVPEGDIFIHAGDFTNWGRLEELYNFKDWLISDVIPRHKEIIIIPGNHDLFFCPLLNSIKDIIDVRNKFLEGLPNSVHLLINEYKCIMGLNIYGYSWVPFYHEWGFNLDRSSDALKLTVDQIWSEKKLDILISHSPPAGCLDRRRTGEHLGCEFLRAKILKIEPTLVVCGHIHEDSGHCKLGNSNILNVSALDLSLPLLSNPLETIFEDWL